MEMEMEMEMVGIKEENFYSCSHDILLVGEGDFSFALSLATSFSSASNIVATSLDSYDTLIRKYKNAKSNLESLKKMGAYLIHRVDATKMKFHSHLKMRKFDRIFFNFPHAGFHGKEDDHRLIKMHRSLLYGFFHNACRMLRLDGEIHVNHKTSPPFCHWNLEELASHNSLLLFKCVPFNTQNYPLYRQKRGDGRRCDESFPLGECSTFKFIISRSCKKMSLSHQSHTRKTAREKLPQPLHKTQPNQDYGRPCTDFGPSENLSQPLQRTQPCQDSDLPITNIGRGDSDDNSISHFPVQGGSSVCVKFREELSWIFGGYFNYVEDMFGRSEERIGYNVHEAVSKGYERFVKMASDRPSEDFTSFLEELHRLSRIRIDWLKQNLEVNMNCY